MYRKRIVSIVMFMVFICSLLITAPVQAETGAAAPLQVNAKSAVLMEPTTGMVLLEQNAHEKLPPASVTKVMTLLLIYEAIGQEKIGWEDIVTVSEHAASMGGSQIFLEPNEKQTVRDLTKSIAVASANDAAVAMAEFIAGSEESFVNAMNSKALALGMKNTSFVNACGLDADGHLTTAYDIALMSRELITKYPEIFEFTKIWQDTIIHKTNKGESEFGLTNTNKLIKWYEGATGLKTGSTGKALYCLSGTAERNGLQLIGVVMASPDYKTRTLEVMKMLDYGFANYAIIQGEPAGKAVGQVEVQKGIEEKVNAVIKSEIKLLIKKGEKNTIDSKVELIPMVKAPFEKGEKVGEIIYSFQGKEVGRCDLVAANGVEKAKLSHMLKKLAEKWF